MNKSRLIIILILIIFFAGCASASEDAAIGETGTPDSGGFSGEFAVLDEPGFGTESSAGKGLSKAEAPPSAVAEAPQRSGLKAGFSDDNLQYGYFTRFLRDYRQDVIPLNLNVSERIMLNLSDAGGLPVFGAMVRVRSGDSEVSGSTLADGSYQINPSELSGSALSGRDSLVIEVSGGNSLPGFYRKMEVSDTGLRNIDINAQQPRRLPESIPLDIVFVMDTTGSMGEEINRLKNTVRIIHMNLASMGVNAEIRFGMVLYKDAGDDYRTRAVPLTGDMELFQASLDEVQACGGGDTPEDLEAALGVLINGMDWNEQAVKLAYIITDAPPHLDYDTDYSCEQAAKDARAWGIKIFGIGTGGLDLQGEYVLRQIAQYTSARYIFLTYGDETGESSGGAAGSVSHHTGSNWSSDKLESIIIRFTREELSYLSDSPLPADDSWFEADRIESESAEETLGILFNQVTEQLLDYSSIAFAPDTLFAVMPFRFEGDMAAAAEYFNEHLILSAAANENISLAERKDIAQLLSEIEFQNSGLTDEGSVSRIGEILNADVLITGNLFMKNGNYELFLKMIRVETAEVLSVTRAEISGSLGI